MSVFSRYILLQVSRPMVATIVIALVALLAERTLRVVDLVVGWRGSLVVVVEMLGYLVPHYMGLAIPVAFFLGVLLTFERLSKEAELAAMFASGAGLARLLRPLLAAAVALMIVQAALASYLQPFGRYAYRAASWALTNASFSTLLQPGIFITLGRTTYMAGEISEDRERLGKVFVHHADEGGGSLTVTAQRGVVTREGSMSPILLELQDGLQQFVPAPQPPGATGSGGNEVVLRFRNFETEFGGGAGTFRTRGEDERELTLPELWQARTVRPPGIEASEIEAELAGRLVRIATLPLLPFIAMPLAVGRVRRQRSYGLVLGLAVLIAFHQVLSFGEALADDGLISAVVGLWLPWAAFATFAIAMFVRSTNRVPDPRGLPWLDPIVDGVAGLFRRRGASARA